MPRFAATKESTLRLLSEGWKLVFIFGWYWLINDAQQPIRVNCNSAKALLKDPELKLEKFEMPLWLVR